jgi:hypothetical protein
MSKPKMAAFFKGVQTSLAKHSPEILTGIGVAGMITTTVLAVKATPKALRLMDEKKQETGKEKLSAVETVKTTWKCYIPAVVVGTAALGCIIGARSVDAKRNAALAAAYKISETAFAEYREKVVETIGEKKERDIRDNVNKDQIENNPPTNNEIIITSSGETLCYDYYSKRYFKSDIDKIKRAVNEINRQLLLESYVSLNDFYDEIGLPGTDYGAKSGWNTVDLKLIEIHIGAHLAENGTPCISIDFEVPPKYNFDRFF